MKARGAEECPDAGRSTSVASANVLYTLGRTDARTALDAVLGLTPDLVGLQEWYPSRLGLLIDTGRVGLAPHLGGRLRGPKSHDAVVYLWNTPLVGGCAVGARADRFELVRCRTRFLSRPGLGDRSPDRRRVEPPREATVAVYRDLLVDRTVCLVNYHLVSGVQVNGRYRTDRPVLTARHRRESETLERLVHEQLEQGHVVYATGDSNFDGLRINGLTSAWAGRQDWPGTLGPHRKVDDVHGPGPAEALTLLTTPSDHLALVVRRPGATTS